MECHTNDGSFGEVGYDETVEQDTGEVIEHQADITFEQRQADLDAIQKAEQDARERERKSPFSHFAQLNLDQTHALIHLTRKSPRAAEIFLFLVQRMDNYNAIVCSHTIFEEALGMSRATVARAVKVLKDSGFIDIRKSGTTNVYLINKEIVWKSWGTNYKYAEFGAKVLIAESEQEQETEIKVKRHTVVEIKSRNNNQ